MSDEATHQRLDGIIAVLHFLVQQTSGDRHRQFHGGPLHLVPALAMLHFQGARAFLEARENRCQLAKRSSPKIVGAAAFNRASRYKPIH